MRIRGRITEDFVNYKKPGLFIPCCYCDFKCCHDNNCDHTMCQNSAIEKFPIDMVDDEIILETYRQSMVAEAVIFGGFEPFWQIDEIEDLLKLFRKNNIDAPFVVYTGYTEAEVAHLLGKLVPYGNVVIKYGRYRPDNSQHKDEVLGVTLISENQYAKEYNFIGDMN